MARVLLCTSYFWPDVTGIALYAKGFADHLTQRGDEVKVVTGSRTTRAGAAPPEVHAWPPPRSSTGSRSAAAGITSRARQSTASRIAYEASFLSGLTALGGPGRPEVVVAISPA